MDSITVVLELDTFKFHLVSFGQRWGWQPKIQDPFHLLRPHLRPFN